MKPEDYIRRLSQLQADRGVLESHLQEVADRVCPRRGSFNVVRSPGAKNMQYVYDSTPIHANELLASGLHGMLTNPATKWFEIRAVDPELNKDRSIKEWLDEVEKITMAAFNSPWAGFGTAMHEFYMEYGAFGTACVFITENTKRGGMLFQSRPLSEIYIAESAEGVIDTVYRIFRFSVRQMVQTWGGKGVSREVRDKYEKGRLDELVELLHAVQPRLEYDRKKRDSKNLPMASVYMEIKSRHILSEGGFHEMPYMVPRFYKAQGETYGRSPGMTALPDIKQLNEMAKTTIKAAQKVVDPPLMAPDKGFINPVNTQPGGLNFYRAGTNANDRISALETRGNIPLSLEMMSELRERIRSTFFVDQLQLSQGPRMTATEVLQRTEEKLRLMGPVVGRIQTEGLGPMIERAYGILSRGGYYPPPPEHAGGVDLRIEYTSPIALAQKQLQAQAFQRVMELAGPVVQMQQNLANLPDGEAIIRDLGESFGLPARWYRSKEDLEAMNEAEEQRQAMQEGSALLNQGAGTVKQLAEAGLMQEGEVVE